MGFSIKHLRNQKTVWHTQWTVDIPPSRHVIRYGLEVHNADTAIVLDDNGFELIVEKRLRHDA